MTTESSQSRKEQIEEAAKKLLAPKNCPKDGFTLMWAAVSMAEWADKNPEIKQPTGPILFEAIKEIAALQEKLSIRDRALEIAMKALEWEGCECITACYCIAEHRDKAISEVRELLKGEK